MASISTPVSLEEKIEKLQAKLRRVKAVVREHPILLTGIDEGGAKRCYNLTKDLISLRTELTTSTKAKFKGQGETQEELEKRINKTESTVSKLSKNWPDKKESNRKMDVD
jgi:hypothetical protein